MDFDKHQPPARNSLLVKGLSVGARPASYREWGGALGTRLRPTSCSLQSVYKLSWCIGLHFVCCVMLLWCANFNDVSTVQLEPLPGQSINVDYQLLLWRKKKKFLSLYNTTPQLYRNFLPQKFRGWTLSFNIFPSMMGSS